MTDSRIATYGGCVTKTYGPHIHSLDFSASLKLFTRVSLVLIQYWYSSLFKVYKDPLNGFVDRLGGK